MTNNQSERSLLRSSIRAKRRQLSSTQQENAANKLFLLLKNHPDFLSSHKLAFYVAIDGEISPHLLIAEAHKLGKLCYLPVLRTDGKNELLFAEYKPETSLNLNYFSLSEPAIGPDNTITASDLDTVFMPLVAFDTEGARLGMGGGYYDRSFEFLRLTDSKSPKLIGLAHECQRVEKLQVATWDVPMEKIITDLKIYQAG